MADLQDLSESLAASLETLSPSLVGVHARRRYDVSGTVWTDDTLVTTHHTTEYDEDITVRLHADTRGGETRSASLIGRDPTTDLALLKVEGGNLSVPTWKGGEGLRVGQLVLMAGRRGGNVRASLGIASALGEPWHTRSGGHVARDLRTDAQPFRGFSGGPLVSASGEVLGVNTSAFSRQGSVTIPTETVERVAKTLLEHGRMRRPYLGVGVQSVRLPESYGEQRTGLLLTSVAPESSGATAGLVLGDTLLELNSTPLRHFDDLQAAMREDLIDQEVTFKVLRGGEVKEVGVTLSERS